MKKKVLSFVAALSMLSVMVLVPLPASAETSGDFTYKVEDGYATITGYNGSEAEVTVPGEIDGYTVTTIGRRAFGSNKTIQKVVISDSIETIGNESFAECSNLKEIVLSKNLKSIGFIAFAACAATNINLPDGIISIGNGAFIASKLTYINLPSSLTTLGINVFTSCSDLAYVRIPHSVASIDDRCFNQCNKDLLTIVGCANSAAQAFAEEQGFTFATIPCKDHTFSKGTCTCCSILLGDLNKDSVVNTDDYTIMIGYVEDPSTCPDLSIADVNQDGVLDINDRLFLLEIISGVSTWPE